MRFKYVPKPKAGDIRVVEKFAAWPRLVTCRIEGKVWVWLETYKQRQVYKDSFYENGWTVESSYANYKL